MEFFDKRTAMGATAEGKLVEVAKVSRERARHGGRILTQRREGAKDERAEGAKNEAKAPSPLRSAGAFQVREGEISRLTRLMARV